MANIIPPLAQKRLWRMYRARFIIVFSIILSTLAVLAALLVVPSFLALRIAAPPPASVNTAQGPGVPDDAIALGRAQAIVNAISPLLTGTSSPSSYIADALALRPAGVLIQSISYSMQDSSIMLTGTAARDDVTAYRDALLLDTHFSSVSVPVAALAGTEGGHFSITLTIAK